jgi:hypothetical protein
MELFEQVVDLQLVSIAASLFYLWDYSTLATYILPLTACYTFAFHCPQFPMSGCR